MWAMCCIPFPPELGYSWNPMPYNSAGPLRSRSFYCLNTIFSQWVYTQRLAWTSVSYKVFCFIFFFLTAHPPPATCSLYFRKTGWVQRQIWFSGLFIVLTVYHSLYQLHWPAHCFYCESLNLALSSNRMDCVQGGIFLAYPESPRLRHICQESELGTRLKLYSGPSACWQSLSLSIHFIAITINVVQTDLK